MISGKGMNALVVILVDDYGDATRGPSFEFETFVPAFRRFFDTVTVFGQDRELRARGYFGAARELKELAARIAPDVLFCVPFENQLDWQTIGEITENGTPTVAWMCDDQWRWHDFSRHIAPFFSAVVTTDRDAFIAYHQLADVRPLLSQWGVDASRLRPVETERDIPVSFIGARRPHRERMISALRSDGIEVLVRGTGWSEGRASTTDLIELPARSLISLNFSDSTQRHNKGRTQLKARPFELAASGSCVVTEPDPQLAAFFDPEREIVVARGKRNLASTVRRLLADEDVRAARARATWERAATQHTYDVRLAKIFSALEIQSELRASEGRLCITR